MAGNVVCQNALCQCDQGAAPSPLAVTSQMSVTIRDMMVATVMDMAPMANVKPFGTCQQLTKMASGVPQPCIPAPTGPWSPGSEVEFIHGVKVLTRDSKLTCA